MIRTQLSSSFLFIAIIFLVGILTQTAGAQQDYLERIGPPQAGAVAPVEMGNINLNNGNLHLEVPLGDFAQRGSEAFSAVLAYDSRIWVPGDFGPSYLPSYRPANVLGQGLPTVGGWRLVVSAWQNGANYLSDGAQCDIELYPWNAWWTIRTGFTWQDAAGTVHQFDPNMLTASYTPSNQANCTPYGDVPNTAGYATDGSGLYMTVTNYSTMTVYDNNGNQVAFEDSVGAVHLGEDTNGNYFSVDASNNVIDTLGRTPVITTVSGNNIFYDVLNSSGTRSRYTITTTSIPVSVPNYSSTMTVVQSITLPNSTSYQFGYDSGTSGDNWGLINLITLPTGGQIGYGYQTFTDAETPQPKANRWVTSRVSAGQTWQYTPLVLSSGAQQSTVTEPSGDYIVYKSQENCGENNFLLKEVDSHSANGTLLSQKLLDYFDDSCTAWGTTATPPTGSAAARVQRLTTTTYGTTGGTLTTKSEYDYTNSPSVGRPTKISEWNFYTGTPSATPDRVRKVTYSLTNPTLAAAHIIGKPLSVTLTDGAGNQVAQTSYTYDNYAGNPLVSTGACQTTTASQPAPAAPQHDYQNYCTSNTVRGNLTQVSKWLNTTGASITTTTNTYDDTGNVITTKDALSNPTQFGYSTSFGRAYVTTITNAKNQVSSKNYDFNTGLLISETDPNNETARYSYDTMGRLIETDFPDQGQTKVSFNNDAVPLTATTTQLATPDPSIVSYTVMDGLGRPQKKCLADPEGDDCADTTYDSNGRVHSKSNPHRTTASASDGVSTFAYDGLDRPTSITEPDNNVGSTSYDTQTSPVLGETTTITDETGRQRRTVTDAFGRVVEADEPGDSFPGRQAYASIDIGGIKTTTVGGSPAVPAKGTVTISTSTGGEQCISSGGGGCIRLPGGGLQCCKVDRPWFRYIMTPPDLAALQTMTCDSGTIKVTINGSPYQTTYTSGSTLTGVANGLVSAITSPSVTAAVTSSTTTSVTITLTATTAGTSGNSITLATSSTFDSVDFTTASFTSSISGSTLTGGANAVAGTPVTDHGTVTMSVGAFTTASVSYGPGTANTTGAQVATALANALTGSGFSGSTNGGTVITATDNSVGVAGNGISVAVHPTSSDSTDFPSPSFSVSPVSLANGLDSYPSGLAHPYVTRYFYDLLDNVTCVEQHGNTTGSDCSPYVMPVTAAGPPAADSTSPWRIRRFAYDSLSRLRWSNDPESGLTSMSYDNNGNLISETDARGVVINYSPAASPIDSLNRVTMITYSDGTPTMTYGYDQGCCGVTPLNGVGRLTYAYGGNTELIFSYDAMGRTKIQWDCPPSGIARNQCYVISAGYDLAGQMRSLTYPDSRTVTDGYNAAGRMTGVTLQNFGSTAVNVPYYTVPQSTLPSTWGYWPTGAMNRGTFGNGIIETTGYNPRQQMNAISDVKGTATLLNRTYGLYDSASHDNGNVLSITDVLSSGKSQSYGYDSLNRIISGSQSDNIFNGTYSYDPWGNMTQSGTSNFSPVYDVHNRIQPAPAGCTSSTPYCYDADGDLLNDGVHAYSYDGEGRIKTVDSTAASYTYNPAGHRVRKDTSTGSTEYFFFGGHIIAELNPSTTAWTDYIYGYGKRIAKDTSTNATGAQYFQTDQIGSTTLVTDSAGNIFWQAVYNAFGQELSAQNTTITFQFAGMQYDSEDSLNHTDFRQYASTEGRWLSPDPYTGSEDPSNPQSFNRYVYVLNNPIRLIDQDGLSAGDLTCQPDDPICLDPDALVADALGAAESKRRTQPCSVVFIDCHAKKLHTKTVENVTVDGRDENVAFIEALPGGGNIHFANEHPLRQRIQCAINAAQGGSIAGVIGQSDNPYVGALLGNQAADAAQTALNIHDVFTAPNAGSAVRPAWDTAVNWFAGKQVSATTAAALSTYSYKNKAVTKALLGGPAKGWSSATNLLKVGAKIVGEAKLAGDALVFGIAYGYSCSAYGN